MTFHIGREKTFAPKAGIFLFFFYLFFTCVTINKGGFILPGNFQRGGSKSHPAAAYFQRKPVHTVILMSDPKISAVFSVHILTGTKEQGSVQVRSALLAVAEEAPMTDRNLFLASTQQK